MQTKTGWEWQKPLWNSPEFFLLSSFDDQTSDGWPLRQVKEIFEYNKIYCEYRTVLFQNEYLRQNFELLCIYARRFSGLIPISFLTGFYVTQVVSRWWSEFLTLPWPDKIAFKLVSYIPGKVLINFLFTIYECTKLSYSPQDLFRKNLRRTVIRYVNLSTVLVYRLVSLRVQQRFPVPFLKHPSCGKKRSFLPTTVGIIKLVK